MKHNIFVPSIRKRGKNTGNSIGSITKTQQKESEGSEIIVII